MYDSVLLRRRDLEAPRVVPGALRVLLGTRYSVRITKLQGCSRRPSCELYTGTLRFFIIWLQSVSLALHELVSPTGVPMWLVCL